MSAKTENSKLKTGKFPAYFILTIAIGLLLVAFAGTFVLLNININRFLGTSEFIKEKTGILTQSVFGSPLLWSDVISIIFSIFVLSEILFVLFRPKKEAAVVKWIDYIDPVSSETVEEKDRFCNRAKIVVDTTERSAFLEGEGRFRGGGGFGWGGYGRGTFLGGTSIGDKGPVHTDSDGDPSH